MSRRLKDLGESVMRAAKDLGLSIGSVAADGLGTAGELTRGELNKLTQNPVRYTVDAVLNPGVIGTTKAAIMGGTKLAVMGSAVYIMPPNFVTPTPALKAIFCDSPPQSKREEIFRYDGSFASLERPATPAKPAGITAPERN